MKNRDKRQKAAAVIGMLVLFMGYINVCGCGTDAVMLLQADAGTQTDLTDAGADAGTQTDAPEAEADARADSGDAGDGTAASKTTASWSTPKKAVCSMTIPTPGRYQPACSRAGLWQAICRMTTW